MFGLWDRGQGPAFRLTMLQDAGGSSILTVSAPTATPLSLAGFTRNGRRLGVGGFEIAVRQHGRLGQGKPAETPGIDRYGHLLLEVAVEREQRKAAVLVRDRREL